QVQDSTIDRSIRHALPTHFTQYRLFHLHFSFFLIIQPPPRSTLFPYTTLFRSVVFPQLGVPDPLKRETAILPGLFQRFLLHRGRSEEHTSELQSRGHLVCRLLLEKKNRLATKEGFQELRDSCTYIDLHANCLPA